MTPVKLLDRHARAFLRWRKQMPEFLVVNPHKRGKRNSSRTNGRAARTKSNPAGVLLSMANPKSKKKSAKRKNPAGAIVKKYKNAARSKRRNPMHRSKNPFNVAGLGLKQVGIISVGAFGGAMATRKVTSFVLGKMGNNNGFVGYGTNVAVAVGLGLIAGKFVGPLFGGGVVAGGVGTIWQRFYDEHIGVLNKVVAAAVGGPADGKGMGDISYDETATLTLEGYYESRFTPDTEILGEIGPGPMAVGAPVIPLSHKLVA